MLLYLRRRKFLGTRVRLLAGGVLLSPEIFFSIYEEENFWGQEYASCKDSSNLGVLSDKGNSILITAKSEWSFYTEENFAGSPTCYTFGDSWGYYSSLGDNSNKFKSVKKGCQSGAARAEPS